MLLDPKLGGPLLDPILGGTFLDPILGGLRILASAVGSLRRCVQSTLCVVLLSGYAGAFETSRVWIAAPAQPSIVRGAERRLLDRAERFLADGQWDDGIAVLWRMLESEHTEVVALEDHRYVSLAEYCHRLIAKLPDEPLAQYRRLVDASAESMFQQGIEERSSTRLQDVADKYFCSTWGDDALFSLGEIALQRGDYQAARNAWARLIISDGAASDRLTYPDSDLPQAEIRARLMLVSIREGDFDRASVELDEFLKLYPDARGRMGGREVVLADAMEKMLEQARDWPEVQDSATWPTFAGHFRRVKRQPRPRGSQTYALDWTLPIENADRSIYPVVADELVIWQDGNSTKAVGLTDGEKLFTVDGETFQSPEVSPRTLGKPVQTLTVAGDFVFGVTTAPIRSGGDFSHDEGVPSTLWSLDLKRQGAIAWEQRNSDEDVMFVGAPVVFGNRLYVPVRAVDQKSRAGVACYDLSTGELAWRQWLCRANTPATGVTDEIVSNLITYDAGVLYINTNLGAMATLRAEDGQVIWLRTYPRRTVPIGAEATSYYRGPHPCVYHRGVVLAMPTDSASFYALDAIDGTALWEQSLDSLSARLITIENDELVYEDDGLHAVDYRTGKTVDGARAVDDFEKLTSESGESPARDAVLAFAGERLVATESDKISVYRSERESNLRQPLASE